MRVHTIGQCFLNLNMQRNHLGTWLNEASALHLGIPARPWVRTSLLGCRPVAPRADSRAICTRSSPTCVRVHFLTGLQKVGVKWWCQPCTEMSQGCCEDSTNDYGSGTSMSAGHTTGVVSDSSSFSGFQWSRQQPV